MKIDIKKILPYKSFQRTNNGGNLMIVGLLGPSCCGKSFFIRALHKKGFYIPLSVTTRPQREDELWHIKQVSAEEFAQLRKAGQLSLVTEAFGNFYACMKFDEAADQVDVAVIITHGNIPELKRMGGKILQILPTNPQSAIEKINALKRGDLSNRIRDLLVYYESDSQENHDGSVYNDYTEASLKELLSTIEALR